MTHKMRFDGCCKGNPGMAGAGAVIYKDDKEIWSGNQFVGEKSTNNIAEYNALLLGFRQAILEGIVDLIIEGDSLLVIKQMKGEYKVNVPHLRDYYERAKNFEKQFASVTYRHIYRHLNKRADELANQAVDNYLKSNVSVCIDLDDSKNNYFLEDDHH